MKSFLSTFSIALVSMLIFSACTSQDTNNTQVAPPTPVADAQNVSSIRQDYIDFEAEIIQAATWDKVESKAQNLTFDPTKTYVELSMNNHRTDLSKFDYAKVITLNEQASESVLTLSSGVGGHHLSLLLIFNNIEQPEVLTIKSLPVGDVAINF